MKAYEMMETVVIAENDLRDKVSESISDCINLISMKTGLNVGGVSFSLVESTNLGSVGKEWRVIGCRIDIDMPDRIYRGE